MDTVERWASANELERAGERFVGPDDIQLFAPEQFEDPNFLCEAWDKDARLLWIRGTNLLNGDKVYVPSQLIHVFYIRQLPCSGPEKEVFPAGIVA